MTRSEDNHPAKQYNSVILVSMRRRCRGDRRDRAIDANRILTDLLVNFRRIVHRGLVNYSGELWYREGLPSDVFRRLVVRKENETPLDRFSGDYEELMTYANFRDLADIIVGNHALRERLTVLEPRDGANLLDRLHELEEMRRSMASNRPASAEDTARLQRYFDDFRTAIKRASHPAASTRGRTELPASRPPATAAQEETLDSIFEPEDEPLRVRKPRPGRVVVKVSTDGLRGGAEREAAPPKATTEPTVRDRESLVETIGLETPVTDVSVGPRPGEDDHSGPVEEIEDLERALRDQDHAAILKALHVEVTEIADGMLRREPKHGHVVWERVNRLGWFEAHRERFELESLRGFYELADSFLEAYASDAKSSELKALLADAQFSKVLLELRDMFLKSRARA